MAEGSPHLLAGRLHLACYEAIRHGQGQDSADAADAAMASLTTAVERPNSHQLTQSWVEHDPIWPVSGTTLDSNY